MSQRRLKPLKKLTADEAHVLQERGTEPAFSGRYTDVTEPGIYFCKQCDNPLFHANDKFHSGCGWPSFDAALPGAISERPDPDGHRTEIICAYCQGHLGHVFHGEGLTPRDTRHCVNSIALELRPHVDVALFAGGCFWGVEYFFARAPGVVSTEVGYSGGTVPYPDYQQVCHGDTGHAEACRIIYDVRQTDYRQLVEYFFAIHDPAQKNRQGPDVGTQYRSVIFYLNDEQFKQATAVCQHLRAKGLDIATTLQLAGIFWPAEPEHQAYYAKNGQAPYCHHYEPK